MTLTARKLIAFMIAVGFMFSLTSCGGAEETEKPSLSKKEKSAKHDDDDGSYKKKSSRENESDDDEEEKEPKPTGTIKINEVDAEQLAAFKVKGLGEKTAEKIVAYREDNGLFKNWSDLDGAPRVGEKMLERLKKQGVEFGDAASGDDSDDEDEKASESDSDDNDEGTTSKSKSSSSTASGSAININNASVSELSDGLKGIGPKTAEKIVAYREENGDFESVDDLTNVKGIGPKSLEKIRESITVK